MLKQHYLSQHHDKAKYVLDNINDPIFISRLVLANVIFLLTSLTQAVAQRKIFNAFSLKNVASKFITSLHALKGGNIDKVILNFLETGKFRYKYIYQNKEMEITADYIINITMKETILEEFQNWIENLIRMYDQYIEIPESVDKVVEFFDTDTSLDRKKEILIWCFQNVNIFFFECEDACDGFEKCSCLEKEIKIFHEHFLLKTKLMTKISYPDVLRT